METSDRHFFIQGGTSLVQNDDMESDWIMANIALFGGRIGRVSRANKDQATPKRQGFDASGLLILPGIIDVHGDAFEQQIQPRPGTIFAHDIALADTDRQLVSNGITTAFHALTYSWEGGLRGREAALALLEQVDLQRKGSKADHRIHLRFENHHVDGLQDVLQWIDAGKIDFLTFNEHYPSIVKQSSIPEKLRALAERARCTEKVFLERLQQIQANEGQIPSMLASLAARCTTAEIPMASHDDRTCEDREYFHGMGVGISEFPKTQDALFTAMALDNLVVMGAPNVLLGGSHNGGLSAIDVIRSRMCDVLASDYYYPSLLHAPFKLVRTGVCALAEAWRMVSENPAKALGLNDRGRIADGCRADLVLVEVTPANSVRLVATIAGGKLAYCAEPQRLFSHRDVELAA